jgi:glycosyltransferase involved in cell wall biosynthesis
MRILFAIPGLHRYNRGAEVAFVAIADRLAEMGESVTLIGSGQARPGSTYQFLRAGSIARERFENFPSFPALRNEFAYEDMTFMPHLLCQYRPDEYDVTVTCNFPFTNLALRRPTLARPRPPHVFVTQNGDWPAYARNSENRFFGCEGLICTNPDYLDRNRDRWRCQLIPNGVDCEHFKIAPTRKDKFGLPEDRLVVLMVSALDPTKRVSTGIEAVSRVPNAYLIVAGDGPLRKEIDEQAARILPGRFTRSLIAPEDMPALYQSADVFLHLSKVESFGNVFLEAMSSGLPIVAHDTPRTRWIVGDEEYLLRADDPDEIAAQVELATTEPFRKKQLRMMRATDFSWQNVAKRYQAFLGEVIKSRQ